jgi:hypothetical protein
MPAGVMLDDLTLTVVQEVRIFEDRALVALTVPGREGVAHQDFGRRPAHIKVVGFMLGDNSLADLEALRKKFQERQPLPFTADIAVATQIQQVVIDDLRLSEVAGRPQQFLYVLFLLEFLPPPPPPTPLEAPDLDAGDLFDEITDLLDELPDLGALDLDLANPLPPLMGIVDSVTEAAGGITSALGPLAELLGD